jgi:hypothetical protein
MTTACGNVPINLGQCLLQMIPSLVSAPEISHGTTIKAALFYNFPRRLDQDYRCTNALLHLIMHFEAF